MKNGAEMSELLCHNTEKEVSRLREVVTSGQIYCLSLNVCYLTMFLGRAQSIVPTKGVRNKLVGGGGICIFELGG